MIRRSCSESPGKSHARWGHRDRSGSGEDTQDSEGGVQSHRWLCPHRFDDEFGVMCQYWRFDNTTALLATLPPRTSPRTQSDFQIATESVATRESMLPECTSSATLRRYTLCLTLVLAVMAATSDRHPDCSGSWRSRDLHCRAPARRGFGIEPVRSNRV
jgi:hypothetical protein